jgi:hypothetical protein
LNKGDEAAAVHSITSSAMASSPAAHLDAERPRLRDASATDERYIST